MPNPCIIDFLSAVELSKLDVVSSSEDLEITFLVGYTTENPPRLVRVNAPDTGGVGAGLGSVTSVGVATANGVSGTVEDETGDAVITLLVTEVSGITFTDGGDGALTVTGTSKISGTNTGDNATNSQYSGLVSNATHTGDATGSTALTLATVNSNVGSFELGTFTVNAKGLITAASKGNPMTTAGDIIVGGASGAPARLALGTALQQPRVNAGGTALEYFTPSTNSATATALATGRAIDGVTFDGTAAISLIQDSTFSGTTPSLTFGPGHKVITGTLSGNTTFSASGYEAKARMTLIITGDSILDTLSFPAWVWLEGAPTELAAGKKMRIDLYCTGTTAGSVVATYGVEA